MADRFPLGYDLDMIPVPKPDNSTWLERLDAFIRGGGPWGTAQPGQRGTWVPTERETPREFPNNDRPWTVRRTTPSSSPGALDYIVRNVNLPGIIPVDQFQSISEAPLSDIVRSGDRDAIRAASEAAFDVAGALPAAGAAVTKAVPKSKPTARNTSVAPWDDFDYPAPGSSVPSRGGFTDEPLTSPFAGHLKLDPEGSPAGQFGWAAEIDDRPIQRSGSVRGYPDLWSNPDDPITAAILATMTGQEKPKGITAYHGSPHDFDRFDMSKIGTGEGAQAYGHGLYFAEAEATAKQYRNKLANRPDVYVGGEPFMTGGEKFDIFAKNDADRTVAARVASWAQHQSIAGDAPGTTDAAIKHVREDLRLGMERAQRSGDFNLWQRLHDQNLSLDRFVERGLELKPNGRMYEVRINADPADFLDWDKPLAQQPQRFRDLVEKDGYSAERIFKDNKPFGESGYIARNASGYPTQQRLKQAGIPGIKYLDQGSRVAGDGSRNYVVFDDALVEILRKYSNPNDPTTAAILALLTQQQGAQPQQ